MAKLVVVTEGLAGLSIELGGNPVMIGRANGNALQVVETSVSGKHCEVVLRGNELHVRDLRSTNGTFVSGQKITDAVLKPGQTFRLGQVEIRFEASAPAAFAPVVPKVPVVPAVAAPVVPKPPVVPVVPKPAVPVVPPMAIPVASPKPVAPVAPPPVIPVVAPKPPVVPPAVPAVSTAPPKIDKVEVAARVDQKNSRIIRG